MATPWYYWQQDCLILHIRLQPRAHCNEIVGLHQDRLKIRLTSPPIDGNANAHLTSFLAKLFQVRKKQVCVLTGTPSRDKRVCIANPVKLLPGIKPLSPASGI
jgi:uncharacterized protein